MFQRFFGRGRESNRAVTEGLYQAIVAAARQPKLYSEWNVPDTPLGRFEMITLHMLLAMRQMRDANQAVRDVAQEVTDHFFLEVDHSLRELGVGDVAVPKRMKRLAKMYYGRAAAYSAALDEADEDALADAFRRNVWPEAGAEGANGTESLSLARYAISADQSLAALDPADFEAGRVKFPAA